MSLLHFTDKAVSYETFISDLVARLTKALSETRNDPEFISQRKAYRMFGRGNVDRWRRQGKITPCKRTGVVEYRTSELRMLQSVIQDYL